MRTKKLSGLENKNISVKKDEKPPMYPNLPQAYYRLNVSGASGSGKGVAVLNMLHKQYPYFDRIFVISPTIHNDPKATDFFDGKDNVIVFDEPTAELIKDIKDELERMIEKHKEYKKIRDIYHKFVKNKYDPDKLTPIELMKLHSVSFDPSSMEMAVNRDKLNFLLYLDDCQGMKILKSPTFENFLIKARHHQTNMIVTTQTFKGVTNAWRRNSTCHFLFKTNDLNQVKSIYEEVAGYFEGEEQFMKIYKYSTDEKHSFMYIDTQDKENPIRKNFDEVIILEQFKDDEK
mgnify:CR=1 FL=1|tara:strand:+ start:2386 stop:3252 length:867 start_codon:yes stop_codon:yes gene_type:complete